MMKATLLQQSSRFSRRFSTRSIFLALVATLALAYTGCGDSRSTSSNVAQTPDADSTRARSAETGGASNSNMSASNTNASSASTRPAPGGAQQRSQSQTSSNVPLDNTASTQTSAPVTDRKIIRNAKLSIELEQPTAARDRISTLVEQRGGFVVSTESRQNAAGKSGANSETITMKVRVPAEKFAETLDEIRRAAANGRILSENITGQDVTEEFIDLEANIRTKRALEAQFLEIMKRATTVREAMDVQSEIADVRAQIERLEGRRQFLISQTTLSTIEITLGQPQAFVQTTGFLDKLGRAFGEGIDMAADVLLALIRVALVLLPFVLFIFLPIGLVIRYFVRRARRNRPAPVVSYNQPPATQTMNTAHVASEPRPSVTNDPQPPPSNQPPNV